MKEKFPQNLGLRKIWSIVILALIGAVTLCYYFAKFLLTLLEKLN